MKHKPRNGLYTFWNEETGLSELHWNGHVLTGTNEATLALMNRLDTYQRLQERVRMELREISDRLATVAYRQT